MMDQPGFNIGDDFYPIPTSYRLGDPVLVTEVTGMQWNDFAELLDSGDPRAMIGVLAVAVWQQHPAWRRDKVVRYIEQVDMDSLSAVGVDAEAPVPPTEADGSATTGGSPATSTPTPDGPAASDGSPATTGLRLSAIS